MIAVRIAVLTRRLRFPGTLGALPIIFAILLGLSSRADAASPATIGRDRRNQDVDTASRANLSDLMRRAGSSAPALEALLLRAYPGYRVVEACEGSFKRAGARDFAAGLLSADGKTAVYAAFVSEASGAYAADELLTFPASTGKGISLDCLSKAGLQRVRAAYAGRRLLSDPKTPAFARLAPQGSFHVACVVPPGDWEFLCYGFDRGKKKLDAVAAWSNDWLPQGK